MIVLVESEDKWHDFFSEIPKASINILKAILGIEKSMWELGKKRLK